MDLRPELVELQKSYYEQTKYKISIEELIKINANEIKSVFYIPIKWLTLIYGDGICQLFEKPKNFNISEVQEIYFVEIKKLSNPNNWSYRGSYSDDWIFMIGKEILWGATAKITRRLLTLDLRQII